jgi:hypothetical protein
MITKSQFKRRLLDYLQRHPEGVLPITLFHYAAHLEGLEHPLVVCQECLFALIEEGSIYQSDNALFALDSLEQISGGAEKRQDASE